MKKVYKAPTFEIETYALDASIASNCGTKVSLGPEYGSHAACEEYDFGMAMYGARSSGNPFYDDTPKMCSCYYSSSNQGYFTS